MSTRMSWLRILVEGAVIVGSILLAFGIDAWWDGHTDAGREQRLLAALLTEFEANEELLGRARAEYETSYMAAARTLEAIDEGLDGIDEDELHALLGALLTNQTFHLESGVLEGLLAAGHLDLIRDQALRHRLAAWPSYVREWVEEEEMTFEFVENSIVPFVGDRTPLREVHPPFAAFPDGEAPEAIPTGRARSSLRTAFASREFENLVYRRAQSLWYAMRDGETLRARISDVTALIRENLNR